MGEQDNGASFGPGSRPSDGAGQAVSTLTGFDPSRDGMIGINGRWVCGYCGANPCICGEDFDDGGDWFMDPKWDAEIERANRRREWDYYHPGEPCPSIELEPDTASAIEARRAETAQTGSVADESAAREAGDAQPEGRHD